MNALTEMMTQQLAGSAMTQLSNKIGADSATTSNAVAIALH